MYVGKDDANGPAQDQSVWKIRRFKVYMGGYAYIRDLTYRVQADLAKSGTAQMLDDAWINYRFIDEAQLQAGQFKIPFSRQELTSDGALQFVDRANAVDAFKPSYDIGAMVQGSAAGGVSYYFGGHNLKLQGDYTNIHIQQAVGKQPTDDRQMRVQAQLAF
jgi:phosphate-selective porin